MNTTTPFFSPRLLYRAASILLLSLAFVLPPFTADAGIVPSAASAAGREMDRQVAKRASGRVSLCFTTPMDVNNLDVSNALARQMQEEISRWFVQAGYDVHEIRKGRDILFEPGTGELLLTRKEKLVGNRNVNSTAIVAGTYTVTPEHVRFNIRIVRTKNREVLAMSTVTLPMTKEIAALVSGGDSSGYYGGTPIQPTVVTLLP